MKLTVSLAQLLTKQAETILEEETAKAPPNNHEEAARVLWAVLTRINAEVPEE